MNPNLDGRWFRSEAYTYNLGVTQPIKLDYLAQARHMTAPEVADIVVQFKGTVGAISGGALGIDAAKTIDTVRLTDEEEVVNASGAMLRLQEQMEFGSKQSDPLDIASGSTNSSYEYRLKVTFDPPKALRSRDYRIPLEHFLEGGELVLVTPAAVPTGWAAVQADQKLRVYMRVVDGRVKELKSRLIYRELAVTNQEYDYEINGSLRTAILGSKLATTGYTSLAAYTTIFSRTLELPPSFEASLLVENYRRMSEALGAGTIQGVQSNDEFTKATPGAIPLVCAKRGYKIGQMTDTKTLHIDHLQAPATSERLLFSAVKNRTPNMSALVAGFTSVEDLQLGMKAAGKVVDDHDSGTPVTKYHPTLVRRLPVRISRSHH